MIEVEEKQRKTGDATMNNWQAFFDIMTTVFGMSKESDDAMICSWVRLYKESGYTPEECEKAAQDVAVEATGPTYRSTVFQRINQRIIENREASIARRVAAWQEERCGDCGGFDRITGEAREANGIVRVPDPFADLAKRRIVAVYCRCNLGQWYQTSNPTVNIDGIQYRILGLTEVEKAFEKKPAAPGQEVGYLGWMTYWKMLRHAEAMRRDEARAQDSKLGQLTLSQQAIRAVKEFADACGIPYDVNGQNDSKGD